MPSHSLRDYLTRKNPTLDSNNSLDGPPPKCEEKGFSEITDWRDFNIENLNNCYGDVLDRHWVDPLPDIFPGPTGLEQEIFDEDSFEHLMTRSIVPPVNESLARALEDLHPDRSGIAINMTRGGRARKSRNPSARTSGTTKFPDWAGAQRATGGYLNLCPGETKLSKKWSSNTPDRHEWFWPLFQITTYCAEVWGTRYGYIITQDEMVAVRISRQPIESGIALTRSCR
ncbi:hypothetical protein ANOM_007146 [Aspergillus nomiae NRRL 13137]|uniref:Uncharacterized protein n=1 Tax=Aspergillus nomiae NRRL (strain ATCC 15546 / NRRL 13137 / CBS 260.88 / M93) TaxID=1509407 RepID=A0A0L1J177_ASPN3|nr:uncharacterized protein ANOM_007146 [Aspergillus nomiae NRRL 13137]KNG85188.1 hypothetical protein ANOM_007146 [Aspergillus nomiae NRRL 13137]